MDTFTWVPDIGAELEMKPNLHGVDFGENYEQTAPAGINYLMERRTLSFTSRAPAESQAIADFLEAQGGYLTFLYTHPNGTAKKYKCKSWRVTDTEGNHQRISAEFQQVPA